ncbi:hypothetical protein ACWGJW_02485 [Streptomyces nigrescens]
MEKVKAIAEGARKALRWARANRIAVVAAVTAVGAIVAQVWTDYPAHAVLSVLNAVLGA